MNISSSDVPVAFKLLQQAEQFTEQRRLKNAIDTYMEILDQHTEHGAIASYNLASLHFHFTGNGEEARKYYGEAISYCEKTKDQIPQNTLDQLKANTCENMMLLSQSYEEYDKWASLLDTVQPDNEILDTHRGSVNDMRDQGFSWTDVLLRNAQSYYDPQDSARDIGRYGDAASTYHLIIENQRLLRADRTQYRQAVMSYGSLIHLLFTQSGEIMERNLRQTDLNQFRLIVDNCLPYLESYLESNPEDKDFLELYKNIYSSVDTAEEWQHNRDYIFRTTREGSSSGIDDTRLNPRAMLIGVVAGVILAILIGWEFPSNVLIGLCFGTFLIGPILSVIVEGVRPKQSITSPNADEHSGGKRLGWLITSKLKREI